MLELLKQPWPWYVAGAIIGLTVPVLLILGNKTFGLSSSLRHICAACFPSNLTYLKYNWKKETWNLFFAFGILAGAYIASTLLKDPNSFQIADSTKQTLEATGVKDFEHLLPTDLFNWVSLFTTKGVILIIVGGFLTGFGTRYAGGCTSGHSIMGLSNLQWPSLVATICFMIGGMVMTWFILPFILKL
ncbi:MAG TPA: YeeE/YedE thiosulfate transporter family protein [Bacteroidia bacterium]|nr:YeeE/YedE thiosulfate transporter family protein [Bacteroidia bacterium]